MKIRQSTVASWIVLPAALTGLCSAQNPTPAPPPAPVGVLQTSSQGTITATHAGSTTPIALDPGDTVGINDTIETGPGSKASILFNDNTEFTLAEKTKLKIDDYVYDPNGTSNKAHYSFLQGVIQYVGGLLDKKDPVNIDTAYGSVGIRGTEFVAKSDGTPNNLEIDLISGAIALTPTGKSAGATTSAPVQIKVSASGLQVLPLTQDQYNSILAEMTPAVPTN
jgi:hypothetical protein